MGEAKSFASLSSGLLARKGAAKPAMRRPVPTSHPAAHEHDDLGWNDMGYDVDPDQNADSEQEGHFRQNPLLGAVPESDPNKRARIEEMAERLNGHALPSDEELDEAAAAAEAESVLAVETEQGMKANGSEVDFEAPGDEPDVTDEITADDNDEAPVTPLLAVKPRAVQQALQSEPRPEPAPVKPAVRKPAAKAKVPAKDKTAFTLRLDHQRHLQLRLACAVHNVSAQKLVTSALDELLATMPELDELTRHLPSRPS